MRPAKPPTSASLLLKINCLRAQPRTDVVVRSTNAGRISMTPARPARRRQWHCAFHVSSQTPRSTAKEPGSAFGAVMEGGGAFMR